MRFAVAKKALSARWLTVTGIVLMALALVVETLSIRASFTRPVSTYSAFNSVILPDIIFAVAIAGIVLVLVGAALGTNRIAVRTHFALAGICFFIGWLISAIGAGNYYYSYDALLAVQWVALVVFGPWFLILAGAAFFLRLAAARKSGRIARS